jgi:hypothetical protein
MSTIFGEVVEALRQTHWDFAIDERNGHIRLSAKTGGVSYLMDIMVHEKHKFILGTVRYDIKVNEEHVEDICALLVRLNYFLSIGGFEFDQKNGEIRFRNSIDTEGVTVTPDFMDNFVKTLAVTASRYRGPINSITEGRPLDSAFQACGFN